jgi:hypothetical protein
VKLFSMNRFTNTYGHATSASQPANENSVARLFRWVVRRVANRRTKVLARVATCALLLGPLVPVHGGWLKPDVDYSNYDSPLWDQIVNHIKAKILARIRGGKLTTDRYFIIPFAFQDRGVNPEHSHSFISVIRVIANAKPVPPSNKLVLSRAAPKTGIRHGEYMGLSFEAFTISWVPHDWDTNPHLCVFDGFASRIFPSNNHCPITVGKNFLLAQSLKQAMNFKAAVGIWGPYEIRREGFELGVRRMKLLDGGTIRYLADDRLTRKDLIAINCFHAMAGLDQLYPNGGLFGTGFMMWGIKGTERVLIEYTHRASDRGILLEPVDYKKDLYGFVYAPKRNGPFVYNPFRNATAYHQ